MEFGVISCFDSKDVKDVITAKRVSENHFTVESCALRPSAWGTAPRALVEQKQSQVHIVVTT